MKTLQTRNHGEIEIWWFNNGIQSGRKLLPWELDNHAVESLYAWTKLWCSCILHGAIGISGPNLKSKSFFLYILRHPIHSTSNKKHLWGSCCSLAGRSWIQVWTLGGSAPRAPHAANINWIGVRGLLTFANLSLGSSQHCVWAKSLCNRPVKSGQVPTRLIGACSVVPDLEAATRTPCKRHRIFIHMAISL